MSKRPLTLDDLDDILEDLVDQISESEIGLLQAALRDDVQRRDGEYTEFKEALIEALLMGDPLEPEADDDSEG